MTLRSQKFVLRNECCLQLYSLRHWQERDTFLRWWKVNRGVATCRENLCPALTIIPKDSDLIIVFHIESVDSNFGGLLDSLQCYLRCPFIDITFKVKKQ